MNLEEYWSTIKNENYQESFPAMETWLGKIGSDKYRVAKISKRRSVMIMSYIKSHKKLAYVGGFVVALLIACNVPIEQEETVGHVLTWTVKQESTEAAKLLGNLSWLDNSQLSATESTIGDNPTTTFKLITPVSTEDEIKEWMQDLQSIKEVSSVKLFPLHGSVTRPAYAAALRSFLRINIDATDLSDVEIEQEIKEQLQALGIDDAKVEYQSNSDGKRFMNLSIPQQQSEAENQKVEMYIRKSGEEPPSDLMNKLRLSFDEEEFVGKSDEEIKSMIEERLKAQGLEGADISVKDGSVRVQVKKKI